MKNIQVREGPDAAGARVWVPGLVERTGDIGGHLQQPQRTSQPSASVFICSGNYRVKIFGIKDYCQAESPNQVYFLGFGCPNLKSQVQTFWTLADTKIKRSTHPMTQKLYYRPLILAK